MRAHATECFCAYIAPLYDRTRDSALRLRYDWSRKYAPNRIRVEARSRARENKNQKELKNNEAARLAPRWSSEYRRPSFRLAFLHKISRALEDHRLSTAG